MDYRDTLLELFHALHDVQGLTRYRIAAKAGVSEQTISNVLNKRRNLSVESLEKLLHSIGYEIRIVPASTGSSKADDEKAIG